MHLFEFITSIGYIAIGIFVVKMTIYEIWRIMTWSPPTLKNVESVEDQRLCKGSKEDSKKTEIEKDKIEKKRSG